MIAAITKLRKLPESCKECRLSDHEFGYDAPDESCEDEVVF